MTYKIVHTYGGSSDVEDELNQAEQDGFNFVAVLNEYESTSQILMHRPGAAPVRIKPEIVENHADEIPF